MRAVLKMGALKLNFGGNYYIISQRIRSLVEIKEHAQAKEHFHIAEKNY